LSNLPRTAAYINPKGQGARGAKGIREELGDASSVRRVTDEGTHTHLESKPKCVHPSRIKSQMGAPICNTPSVNVDLTRNSECFYHKNAVIIDLVKIANTALIVYNDPVHMSQKLARLWTRPPATKGLCNPSGSALGLRGLSLPSCALEIEVAGAGSEYFTSRAGAGPEYFHITGQLAMVSAASLSSDGRGQPVGKKFFNLN
jgi:hypothetical protein